MRHVALLVVGVLLLLVQGNLFRFWGNWQGIQLAPDLVLPVVLFIGINESSMARGALLAFGLGYSTDLLGSAPIGLFSLSTVAIWWLARVAAVRLSAQTLPSQLSMTLAFSVIQSAIVLTLLTIFGQDPQRPIEIARSVLPQSLGTAACSPFVFALAQRIHQGIAVGERSGEAGS